MTSLHNSKTLSALRRAEEPRPPVLQQLPRPYRPTWFKLVDADEEYLYVEQADGARFILTLTPRLVRELQRCGVENVYTPNLDAYRVCVWKDVRNVVPSLVRYEVQKVA